MDYNFVEPYFELDEERDLNEETPFWVANEVHSMPPWSPSFAWNWMHLLGLWGAPGAADEMRYPRSKGQVHRVKDGINYLSVRLVTDKEEQRQREVVFKEKIKPWIDDFEEAMKEERAKLLEEDALYRKFIAEKEKYTDFELFKFFHNTYWPIVQLRWIVHYKWMNNASMVMKTFSDLTQTLFGFGEGDVEYATLLAGVGGNLTIEADSALWDLGRRAILLKLKGIFETSAAGEIIPKLRGSTAGREWLRGFDDFLGGLSGWRTPRMTEIIAGPWFTEPSQPLVALKAYVGMPDAENPRLKEKEREAEREQQKKETLARVPAEQREWFRKLMRAAQIGSRTFDDHALILDYPDWATYHIIAKEATRRLIAKKVIDPVDEDAYYLLTVPELLAGLREVTNLRPFVGKRREAFQANQKIGLGHEYRFVIVLPGIEVPEIMARMREDPISWGIGIGRFPTVKPELKADLYGLAASSGVIEGRARVVTDVEKIGEVKAGEILVAMTTWSSWTPAFAMVSGVVTDAGGITCHAAVVGREYGLPVVTNTMEATRKIRTGQRIRVDGNLGVVYFLEK